MMNLKEVSQKIDAQNALFEARCNMRMALLEIKYKNMEVKREQRYSNYFKTYC